MAALQEADDKDTGETSVLSRHSAAFAIGGGIAAAFGSSFIPMTAIEGFVTAYGIAELLPAAAPPLGDTARLALSGGIGTLTAGALLALLPRGETDEMGYEATVKMAEKASKDTPATDTATGKSGKLAGWLRTLRFGKSEAAPGTVTDFADINRLRIRNGDHHPDAPVRAPIRASSDLAETREDAPPFAVQPPAAMPLELGADMTFTAPVVEAPAPDTVPALSMRFAPPDVLTAEVEAEPAEQPDQPEAQAEATAFAEVASADEEATTDTLLPKATATGTPAAEPADDALETLSVSALLGRLEAGLARRRQASAGLYASGSPAPEATARLFSLAKPASLVGDSSVDEITGNDEARPLRFRLDQPPVAVPNPTESDERIAEERRPPDTVGEFADDIEYHDPILTQAEPADIEVAPAGDTIVEDTAAEPDAAEAPAAAAQPIDDDMDAALRDALATLRQLSDRQRHS